MFANSIERLSVLEDKSTAVKTPKRVKKLTVSKNVRTRKLRNAGKVVVRAWKHLPCLTHLSRTGSLLCLTTAWTSLVVSPATGVSLTSRRSSSVHNLPLWHTAVPGRSSPITGNCPFSAPPFNSSPSSPSSFLQRTLSWTLLVQWFFLFFRVLDMAQTRGNHMSAVVEEVFPFFEVPQCQSHTVMCPVSAVNATCIHVSAQQLDHQSAFALTGSCSTCDAFKRYLKDRYWQSRCSKAT